MNETTKETIENELEFFLAPLLDGLRDPEILLDFFSEAGWFLEDASINRILRLLFLLLLAIRRVF